LLTAHRLGVVFDGFGRQRLAREQLFQALHMALLVGCHLGGEGAHRVVGRMLGDVDVEILRAATPSRL